MTTSSSSSEDELIVITDRRDGRGTLTPKLLQRSRTLSITFGASAALVYSSSLLVVQILILSGSWEDSRDVLGFSSDAMGTFLSSSLELVRVSAKKSPSFVMQKLRKPGATLRLGSLDPHFLRLCPRLLISDEMFYLACQKLRLKSDDDSI